MYFFLSLKHTTYIIKGDRLLLCFCPFFNSIAKILLTEGRDDERKRWIE